MQSDLKNGQNDNFMALASLCSGSEKGMYAGFVGCWGRNDWQHGGPGQRAVLRGEWIYTYIHTKYNLCLHIYVYIPLHSNLISNLTIWKETASRSMDVRVDCARSFGGKSNVRAPTFYAETSSLIVTVIKMTNRCWGLKLQSKTRYLGGCNFVFQSLSSQCYIVRLKKDYFHSLSIFETLACAEGVS
jgi:hypothetical protein